VAGACVGAGAAVVAGDPQAERSREVRTSTLVKDHNRDFLFISLSFIISTQLDHGCDMRTRVLFLDLD
jgi:hypothetical protein